MAIQNILFFGLSVFAFAIVSAAQADEPIEFSEEWMQCEADTQCVKTQHVCFSPTAVNSKHKKAFDAYVAYEGTLIDCAVAGPLLNEDQLKPVCRNQQCTIEPEPEYGEVE